MKFPFEFQYFSGVFDELGLNYDLSNDILVQKKGLGNGNFHENRTWNEIIGLGASHGHRPIKMHAQIG